MRLRHLHPDLGLGHLDCNLRLRLLDRYGWRRYAHGDLRLGLTHGYMRLRLLHPDPRCRRCVLNLGRLLLYGDPGLLLARLLGLLLLQGGLLHLLHGIMAGLLIALDPILSSLLERQRRAGRVLLEPLDKLLAGVAHLRLLAKLLLLRLLLLLRTLHLRKGRRGEGRRPEESGRDERFHRFCLLCTGGCSRA